MPAGAKRLLSVLVIAGSVSLLVFGCGKKAESGNANQAGANASAGPPSGEVVNRGGPDSLAAAINRYLGTSADRDTTTLLGNMNANNKYLREVIHDLQCDIWKLKHPGQTPQGGCPPGTGPSTSPTNPPTYPQ